MLSPCRGRRFGAPLRQAAVGMVEDFAGFLDYIKKSAGENVADAPAPPAPLLTLSTCTSTTATGRFVVEAVYIGEKTL